MPQEIREALCGHASKSVNVRVYGDTPLIAVRNKHSTSSTTELRFLNRAA